MPKKKHLPSPGSAPGHQDTRGMRFKVSKDGDIKVAPVRFGARKGDFLLWAVVNDSGGPIRVAIIDFLRKENFFDKKGTIPYNSGPVDFFAGQNSVDLNKGEKKVIGGTVSTEPESGFIDGVSYTIRVTSLKEEPAFAEIDYDPDGEIKP
jgi:hypothetical protein